MDDYDFNLLTDSDIDFINEQCDKYEEETEQLILEHDIVESIELDLDEGF